MKLNILFCILIAVLSDSVASAALLQETPARTGLPAPDGPSRQDPSERTDLARHFGFSPLQMYKIKPGMTQLKIADLNSDGRNDIAVWNSHQSRIEILYQPAPADPAKPPPEKPEQPDLERNEVPNRGNMRVENVPVAYRLASMEIADLTGDKLNDIVFFGEPKEVVILAGKPDGGFAPAVGTRAPEGNPRGGGLCAGDFNSDGRTDVAVLGDEFTLVFHQKAGGGLEKPLRLVHGIKQPLMIMTGDFNGDGRHDLVVSASDETYGAYVRLQESGGRLGPQRRVKTPMLRSMTVAHTKGGDQLFCVQHVTGRLKHYRWEAPSGPAAQTAWPELLYSYPSTSKGKQRPIAVGDVTGDGLLDVVTGDPDGAQLILFEQQKDAGLRPGVAFPGLVKATDVWIADVDGDATAEVLSVSAEEKMIGVSRFKEGRLTFPTPVPAAGEPYAVTVGPIGIGGTNRLAYITKVDSKFTIRVAPLDAARLAGAGPGKKASGTNGGTNGSTQEAAAAGEQQIDVGELREDPAGLRLADVDQDGRNDLLLFIRYGGLHVYLSKPDGSFARLTGPESREGPLKDATVPGFDMADVTGDGKPEVILVQKNLARALVVKDGQWTVVDQYNPENADAEISGIAAIPGQPGSPTITMYDRKSHDLMVLKRREDNTYAVAESMPTGTYELTAMTAAPVAGGPEPALIMADAQTLALLSPTKSNDSLVEKHSYETTVKDAWLADAVPGDVNGDGVRDVAVVDVGKAHIEILTTLPDGELVKATRFQVFQGKRFSDAPGSRREPREALVGDVTSDKIDDVVVLVHDRIIVYPGQ